MTAKRTVAGILLWAGLLIQGGSVRTTVGQDEPAASPTASGGQPVHAARDHQRTMRLLAASTPEHRNTVRILFYGQSITEQAWWKQVADNLRARFPHANLIIENRAIGGHSSQLLVKTAEADLYPFQPDLLIFHVYGAHDKYEDIIKNVRERTTAEILLQNDHVTRDEDFEEETDPAKLAPRGDQWNAFMNHNWLPYVAEKYGAVLCDQRSAWKQHLRDNELNPADLLRDGVHLNERGERLMAEIVTSYLVYDPSLGPSDAEAWVKTLEVGKDVTWQDGKLRLEFDGSRVDAILAPGKAAGGGQVRIDGKRPSEWAECYTFTRTSAYPGMNWPCLLRVQSQTPRVEEDWTLTLRDINDEATSFRFSARGSVTGEDGEGTAGERFVSRSGRVVIEPEDWNLAYARQVRRSFAPEAGPPADGFTITWKSVLMGRDEVEETASEDPTIEHVVTLAQGLPNGRHVLEVESDAKTCPIVGLRVHAPPLPVEAAGH